MGITTRARRVAIWLTMATAVLGIGDVVMHRNRDWFNELPAGIWQWFDLNAESSFGTWLSVSLLLLIAVGAALAAAAEPRVHQRTAWIAIAVGAMLLSIDDKISAHERLPELFSIERQSRATHEWLLPGVIIGGIGLVLLVFLTRSLSRRVRLGLLLGLTVFALGAIVIEGVSGVALRSLPTDHPLHLTRSAWVLVEETLELLGTIIALAAVQSHLERTEVLRV